MPVLALADSDQWLHVSVDDDEDRVRINLPMNVVHAVVPLIEADEFRGGRVRIDDADFDPEDVVKILRAVKEAKDGEYITVEGRDENVKVRKEGEYIHVDVEETRGRDPEVVHIKVPVPVLTALVSGEADELNILAAIEALAAYESEELVTVNGDGSKVRIWIDKKSSS
jgi:TusA-related sulfurtransferase